VVWEGCGSQQLEGRILRRRRRLGLRRLFESQRLGPRRRRQRLRGFVVVVVEADVALHHSARGQRRRQDALRVRERGRERG